MGFKLKESDYILEVKPLDKNIPACSQYQRAASGYFLYSRQNQWVFPFFKKKIKFNIKDIYLPSDCIGIITDSYQNVYDYKVITKRIISHEYDYFIKIRSRKLLPFKIKKGWNIALLSIIPSIECHTVIFKTDC